jgi:hypothetical protein
LGARYGVLRARYTVPRGLSIQDIFVTERDIIVACPGVLFMVDSNGGVLREFSLPDDSWSLRSIGSETLVVSSGDRLRGLGLHDGDVRWERSLPGPFVAFAQTADGGFACLTRSLPPTRPLRLSVFAPDASLRWESERLPVGLGLQRFQLAFDDDEVLYVHSVGRLGDGVTGEDALVGALSAFSSTGEHLWKIPQSIERLSLEMFGRSSGAFLRGLSVYSCTPDGTLVVTPQERTVSVGAREFQLGEEGVPLMTLALSAHSKVVQLISFDGSMNSYANFEGMLFSLDRDLSLRWCMEGFATYTPPIIGPEQTLLINLRTELVIIE